MKAPVAISLEQIETIENAGYALVRAGEYREAVGLFAIALEIRFAGGFPAEAGLENVVELHSRSRRADGGTARIAPFPSTGQLDGGRDAS